MLIDLRSDTVTKPTERMIAAMAKAPVGDDGYGDDPSVNELETLAAATLGKAAGVYVPSGAMGNLVALLSWSTPGGEVLAEAQSHVMVAELGGLASLAGQFPRAVTGSKGRMALAAIKQNLRERFDAHGLRTAVLCLENTHTASGGRVLDADYTAQAAALARDRGIPVHLDGARLFNAAVALKTSARELAAPADSVMVCLSKGLSAPIGSVLCGSHDFVDRARAFRKMVGGGMRQAGVIAAAGIVALTEMVDRLADDHAQARLLAEALHRRDARLVDPAEVETNIVLVEVASTGLTAGEWATRLKQRGILAGVTRSGEVRFATNRHIGAAEVTAVLTAFAEIVDEIRGGRRVRVAE